MICTNGGSGSVSQYTVYSQNEGDDRIASFACGQRVSVGAGCVNSIAIPIVWQLVGTDRSPGSIS